MPALTFGRRLPDLRGSRNRDDPAPTLTSNTTITITTTDPNIPAPNCTVCLDGFSHGLSEQDIDQLSFDLESEELRIPYSDLVTCADSPTARCPICFALREGVRPFLDRMSREGRASEFPHETLLVSIGKTISLGYFDLSQLTSAPMWLGSGSRITGPGSGSRRVMRDGLGRARDPEDDNPGLLIYRAELYLDPFGDDEVQRCLKSRQTGLPDEWKGCFFRRRDPVPNVLADGVWQGKVKGWLGACLSGHEACKRSEVEVGDFVPDRLLDLQADTPSGLRLSLVSHIAAASPTPALSTHAPGTRYTALSYCWGAAKIASTTSATLPARLDSVAWSDLPTTYQQAVALTRALGVRYLWIDSLCIIQGDTVDFSEQTSQMGLIYQHALLVVAADRAPDTEAGFLGPRDCSSLCIDIPPHKRRDHHEAPRIWADQRPAFVGHTVCYNRHAPFSPQNQDNVGQVLDPVFNRAWCLQERLLATRLVHFTSMEMAWECRSETRCECMGDKCDADPLLIKRLLDRLQKYLDGRNIRKEGLDKEYAQIWWTTVRRYSQCSITNDADRLPAISGLARRLKRPSFGRYLAGMWEAELPFSLLWRADQRTRKWGPNKRTRDGVVAPSWSWISVLAPVAKPGRWGSTQLELCATLGEIHVEIVPEGDEFGALQAAYLDLTGPTFIVDMRSGEPVNIGKCLVPTDLVEQVSGLTDFDVHAEIPLQMAPGLPAEVLAMLVARETGGKYIDSFLLLVRSERVEKDGSPLYKRIGVHALYCDPEAVERVVGMYENWERKTIRIV